MKRCLLLGFAILLATACASSGDSGTSPPGGGGGTGGLRAPAAASPDHEEFWLGTGYRGDENGNSVMDPAEFEDIGRYFGETETVEVCARVKGRGGQTLEVFHVWLNDFVRYPEDLPLETIRSQRADDPLFERVSFAQEARIRDDAVRVVSVAVRPQRSYGQSGARFLVVWALQGEEVERTVYERGPRGPR